MGNSRRLGVASLLVSLGFFGAVEGAAFAQRGTPPAPASIDLWDGDDQILLADPPPAELPTGRVLAESGAPTVHYINFSNGTTTLTKSTSGIDDAPKNTSVICGATPFPPFDGADAEKKTWVGELQRIFAPYNIVLTTARPTSGSYSMEMVGPQGGGCTPGPGIGGIAPLDCGNLFKANISFTFGKFTDGVVTAQESGHAFGLEHVDVACDVMGAGYSGKGCPAPGKWGYIDAAGPRIGGGACGGSTQNSHQILAKNLGLWPGGPKPDPWGGSAPPSPPSPSPSPSPSPGSSCMDMTPPSLTFVTPVDGAVLPGDFTVRVEAKDDCGPARNALINLPDQPYMAGITGAGPYQWELRGIKSGEAITISVTIWDPTDKSTTKSLHVKVGAGAGGSSDAGRPPDAGGVEGSQRDGGANAGPDGGGAGQSVASGCNVGYGGGTPPTAFFAIGLPLFGLGMRSRRSRRRRIRISGGWMRLPLASVIAATALSCARVKTWPAEDGSVNDGARQADLAGGAKPEAGGGDASSREYVDPSAPPGIKDAFGGPAGTDAASRPGLVYPLAGAMLGRNIGGMNIQWKAGAGNMLFRLRVVGDRGEARLYAGPAACPGGKCRLSVPDAVWLEVATANAGAKVSLEVAGVSAPGGAVSRSEPATLYFSPEDLKGGLYYFSTKLPGIMRVGIGDATPEPFIKPMSPANPTPCTGCHTLTRDGCRLAFTYETGDGNLGIASAVDPTRTYLDPKKERSNFQTWSPDGERLLTLKTGEMILRDSAGRELARVPRAFVGAAGEDTSTHPEWSPDGVLIAFTRLAKGSAVVSDWVHSGDIMIMPYAGGGFGTAKVLVANSGDERHYYPHFSPDSKWIVFNTGKLPGKSPAVLPAPNLSSYDQTSSRLRLVKVDGGSPVELSNATHGTDVAASWPKFSPFVQRSGNLFFIVFSSRLDYGWLLEQASIAPQPPSLYGRPQLWVAAIDVSVAGDPSLAPFRLPFQLTTEGTHLGYWTTKIAGKTGGASDCK